ncbi:Uncharacterised protein [uncultured archaeon]|nr:Uncharacterised protein [uncultured archaeon]
MQKNKLATIGFVVLILAVAGGVIFFKNFQGASVQDTDAEKVAKWIGEHSVLYVQTGCIHCKEQEDLFGSNVKYLNIIDCLASSENQQACAAAEIKATPTWIIEGKAYIGVETIDELKKLTNYSE